MTFEEITLETAKADINAGKSVDAVLAEVWKKSRMDTMNYLGTSGELSWGRVAEITGKD